MADGDVLTIVAGHQAFAAPTGGVQTITLIGPFPVTFATPDIFTNGATVATIPAGALVISAWAEPTDQFDGGGTTTALLEVWVGDQATFGGSLAYQTYGNGFSFVNDAQSAEGWPVRLNVTTPTQEALAAHTIRCKQDADLYVWVNAQGGTPTGGAADIYALIGTPT